MPRPPIYDVAEDWRDIAHQVLIEAGLTEEEAERLSVSIVSRITGQWGGEMLYIPVDWTTKQRQRDAQIAQEYDGTLTSRRRLMRKHKIGLVAFYQSLNRGRKANPAA